MKLFSQPWYVLALGCILACSATPPTTSTAEAGEKPAKGQKASPKKAAVKPQTKTAARGVEGRREAWYSVHFGGEKMGHVHSIEETTIVGSTPAMHIHQASLFTVRRQQQVLNLESALDIWVAKDGTPLRYKLRRNEAQDVRTSEGYRDGKEFVVRTEIGGAAKERRFPLGKNIYLASSVDWILSQNLSEKLKIEGQAFNETTSAMEAFSAQVEKVEIRDGKKVYVIAEKLGPLLNRLWMDENGVVLRSEAPQMGIVTEKTTSEKALELGKATDIFSKTLFGIPKALPSGHSLDSLEVSLKLKSGRKTKYISDAYQKVKKTKDGVRLTLTVGQVPKKPAKLPVRDKKFARYLTSTDYEQIDDESLVAAAKAQVRGAKDVWTAAQRINSFVYGHIGNKSLARAYASASEVLQSKEGDCTEHAVLFSALAKIVGIPTRLVTGLVYVGGEKHVFGYHQWVEIWTGQKWLAMDPTFGQSIADPTHIKFSQGLSDPKGMQEAGLAAASIIGDLELSVLSYTQDGKKMPY